MTVYYNENDPYCAQWLRNLAAAGHIAPGDVDARDIRDVSASDLAGYDQCHFFAGIGLWSLALRWAGWPDDRPVWTGSCPCQPFSAAGRGAGFADDRHLWPAWEWLIAQRRPVAIIGEQVGSPAGLLWLDVVSAGLEAMGYALGAVDLPSAGVGAPNIRQRLWWMGHSESRGRGEHRVLGETGGGGQDPGQPAFANKVAGGLADAAGRDPGAARLQRGGQHGQRASDGGSDDGACGGFGSAPDGGLAGTASTGWMGHADRAGRETRDGVARRDEPGPARLADTGSHGRLADAQHPIRGPLGVDRQDGRDGPHAGRQETHRLARTRGQICEIASGLADARARRLSDAAASHLRQPRRQNQGRAAGSACSPPDPWRFLEWIDCLDGRRRPVEPGVFPLAARHPGDVARLRAYGNAINPVVAAQVIRAFMDIIDL